MSLLDLHGESVGAASPFYIPPIKPKGRAWGEASAIFRGAGEALTQIGATGAALLSEGASIAPGMELDAIGPVADIREAQRRERARDEEFIREGGRSLRPDETASRADQIIYDLARGVTKLAAGAVAGGVPGVLAVSAEEGFTQTGEAMREGIDADTAAQLGAVQAAGLALGALPAFGQTVRGTAALYLAGGPGGFVAQQALTKEILQRGGYEDRADQVDILDPVGLAVSALSPAPFAVVGVRRAIRAREIPKQVHDAALVLNERQWLELRKEEVAGSDPVAQAKHVEALATAERQIQDGEPVSVADPASMRMARSLGDAIDEVAATPEAAIRLYRAEAARLMDTAEAAPTPEIAQRTRAAAESLSAKADTLEAAEATPRAEPAAPKKADEQTLAEAYDAADLAALSKEADQEVRNIVAGMLRAAPEMQALRAQGTDLAPPLVRAVREFAAAKAEGLTVEQHIARDAASVKSLTPATHNLLVGLSENAGNPKRVAEMVRQFVKQAKPSEGVRPPEGDMAANAVENMRSLADTALDAEDAPVVKPAEDASHSARLADLEAEAPTMKVAGPDGDPMPLSEFLAEARAQAEREAQEAELLQAAVQCALTNGF